MTNPDAGALGPIYGRGARMLSAVGGPDDSFFGVALSPDGSRVPVVGVLGRDTSGGAEDDAAVLRLRP